MPYDIQEKLDAWARREAHEPHDPHKAGGDARDPLVPPDALLVRAARARSVTRLRRAIAPTLVVAAVVVVIVATPRQDPEAPTTPTEHLAQQAPALVPVEEVTASTGPEPTLLSIMRANELSADGELVLPVMKRRSAAPRTRAFSRELPPQERR